MNEKRFKKNTLLVISFYLAVVFVAVTVRIIFSETGSLAYSTLRDLIPIFVALPAAWLAYCFQRRIAYLHDVRDIWFKIVGATQSAVQYTHMSCPTQSEYGSTLKELSVVIDEIRALFINLGASSDYIGLYPFENLKCIHQIISDLNYGENVDSNEKKIARDKIIKEWKEFRKSFLQECARGEPLEPNSPFLN